MDRYKDRMWDGEAIFVFWPAAAVGGYQTWLATELPSEKFEG